MISYRFSFYFSDIIVVNTVSLSGNHFNICVLPLYVSSFFRFKSKITNYNATNPNHLLFAFKTFPPSADCKN